MRNFDFEEFNNNINKNLISAQKLISVIENVQWDEIPIARICNPCPHR